MDVNKNQAEDHGEDNQNESEMIRLEDQRKALDEQVEELRTKSSELGTSFIGLDSYFFKFSKSIIVCFTGKKRYEYDKESEQIDRVSNKQKNSLESLKRRMNNLRD